MAALLSARPAGPALIVTTRTAPPAGPTHVWPSALPAGDARDLFGRVAGRGKNPSSPWYRRVTARPAVRLAGALLARRPHWMVDGLLEHLANSGAGSNESDR